MFNNFNRLCGFAERYNFGPESKRIIERSAPFDVSQLTQKLYKRQGIYYTKEEQIKLMANAKSPFPIIAVCNETFCFIVEEVDTGFLCWGIKKTQNNKVFICLATNVNNLGFDPSGRLLVTGTPLKTFVINNDYRSISDEKIFTSEDEETREYRDCLVVGGCIIELILLINCPLDEKRRAIVESKPKKTKETKKIKRAHQRATYTLMHLDKFWEKTIKPGKCTGRKIKPHGRRGYWRVYKDQRYSEDVRSKPQWIKATFVGTLEAEKGNKYYRVLVDK